MENYVNIANLCKGYLLLFVNLKVALRLDYIKENLFLVLKLSISNSYENV